MLVPDLRGSAANSPPLDKSSRVRRWCKRDVSYWAATDGREFLARGSADVSRTIAGVRCRINIFQTLRGVAMAIRLLSSFQNNLRACNLHPDLKRLTEMTTGLIVVSGPTGSGKSTTLAALVEEINSSGARNIIAIESPIEYVFINRRSFI